MAQFAVMVHTVHVSCSGCASRSSAVFVFSNHTWAVQTGMSEQNRQAMPARRIGKDCVKVNFHSVTNNSLASLLVERALEIHLKTGTTFGHRLEVPMGALSTVAVTVARTILSSESTRFTMMRDFCLWRWEYR